MMPGASAKPFRHAALLYAGRDAFLSGAVPFICEGLAAGEPVMVAVDAEKSELLSRTLGPQSAEVMFADAADVGANPTSIIAAWDVFLGDDRRGRPARGIGEPIRGLGEANLVESQLHEALLNRAFADAHGFELLCPYDATSLPVPVLQEACCSHPFIAAGHDHHVSPSYRGPDAVPPAAQAPLGPPPPNARTLGFDRHNLAEVRALTGDCARAAGLNPAETSQFMLGIHELAANSVRHAGGIGVLRTWTEDGAAVCEVRDTGHIQDPLAGRRPPRPGQLGGWGIWIANAACDLMQIRTGPRGTVIRARRSSG